MGIGKCFKALGKVMGSLLEEGRATQLPLMADTGLGKWDVSILSPVLLLCFQPEVPACSALLQPSSSPRQKGCYTNNNSVTSPDQCHPSPQENRGRKALKELWKNSVSGVGMK